MLLDIGFWFMVCFNFVVLTFWFSMVKIKEQYTKKISFFVVVVPFS